jgi:hypothetical protein
VWQEHLRRFLSIKEAAGLRAVCKALKVLVREWPMCLGEVYEYHLEVALKCFPATKSFEVNIDQYPDPEEEARLVEVLREHGGTLKDVTTDDCGHHLLSSAVLSGALPNLIDFAFYLKMPSNRQILSEGMLGLLEAATVRMNNSTQLAVLEHLRRLPHLQDLWLISEEPLGPAFPPFIPPSLKALTVNLKSLASLESLVGGLPSMLQASGASLKEIRIIRNFGNLSAASGAALARAFHTCSSTLKTLSLHGCWERETFACLPTLVPGLMSCCDTLKFLHCPWMILSALPATCPSFKCLNELHLHGYVESSRCTWLALCVLAAGRLPALATLCIDTSRRFLWEEGARLEEEDDRLERAFEAVAGTLEWLEIEDFGAFHPVVNGAAYKLGAAIGKLRRLKVLHLDLQGDGDGRTYHAVGRGIAASGGCPELRYLRTAHVIRNMDWLIREPSLIVPSVRDLCLEDGRCTEDEALLLCCGLVQMGYKYRLNDGWLRDPQLMPLRGPVLACVRAILQTAGVAVYSSDS